MADAAAFWSAGVLLVAAVALWSAGVLLAAAAFWSAVLGAAALLEAAVLSCALGVVPADCAFDGLVLEALLDGVALLAEVSLDDGVAAVEPAALALEALVWSELAAGALLAGCELAALWSLEAAGAAEDADWLDISLLELAGALEELALDGLVLLAEVAAAPASELEDAEPDAHLSEIIFTSLTASELLLAVDVPAELLEDAVLLLGVPLIWTSCPTCACNLLVSPVSA